MELGEVVAERQIEGVAPDGSHFEVVIRFGAPRPDPLSGNGDWVCPHQIAGLGDDSVGAAYGVDSLQALLLSVYAVRVKLAESGGTLDWLGMPELGLTVAPVLS
ncbi:DUF6968 family protein [Lentzea flava]|uniref:DUF6968 domain-containing protein n=1 Tax=Lentzea flava TaxID=103732 RepID=A0ABQ2UW82_9PSEU|nr:hypothetical protein [Lentzea flava]MCP2201984.1 hypothetical protein [Lentzea flava]GGU54103.1 hypothetical protein GCM10010178_53190 [Lentzea flava]